jgi:hypothetical protein
VEIVEISFFAPSKNGGCKPVATPSHWFFV